MLINALIRAVKLHINMMSSYFPIIRMKSPCSSYRHVFENDSVGLPAWTDTLQSPLVWKSTQGLAHDDHHQ